MDIRELQSFQLSDAVKFHDHLNPKIFHGQHVRPEVEKQLKIIAGDFLEELGVDGLDVQDITISGSNAAYSYTPHSDLDLHILVDMTKLHDDDMYRELFDAKKNAYNDSHNIKIHGIPVELYIQDSSQPVISLGEYSIKNNKWLKIPSKRRANFDQTATARKYEKILAVIQRALKTQKLERVQNVLSTIKRYRQAGLDKGGEFGPENLAYKALRSQGYITALYKLRDELHSKELSIESMYAEADKSAKRPAPTIEQLVIKYKVPKQDILIQLDKGIKVELKKSKDRSDARELALHNINSDPHYYNRLAKSGDDIEEDYSANGPPPGPEFKPTMPAGTVKVDVSDVYDWYKLGQHISNLKGLGQHDFGSGPPSTIMAFGSEPEEHKYIDALKKTGLTTTDIDPLDPNQPKSMPRQKVDPTYNVNEAFDQPYRLKWEQGDYGDVDAYAKLDDGNYLSIMFNKGYSQGSKEEAWSVEFFRNNSQEVTGEGDAQRVFATVLSAIQTFIKKYKPNRIIFSASKEVEPGQNAQSRARLYDSLVQRYAKAWGFRAFRADTGNKVIYELDRINKTVDEARTNPEQNIKPESGFKELASIAKTISDPENWAISMTSEPKLGINPQVGISEDTPKGIYFYPLNYALGKTRYGQLPWGNDYPYIQLFQYDRSHEMTKQTKVDTNKLKQALLQYCPEEIIQQAIDDPEYDGTPYWFIYDCLSRLGKSDETNVVRWNKVLRDLGFTSVYDDGAGWIAYNEPTQGVVLDPRVIKQHKTIVNKKQSGVVTPAVIEQSIFETMDMELARNRAWQAYDPDGSKLRAAAKEYAKKPEFKQYYGKPGTEEIFNKVEGWGRYGARQLSDIAYEWYKQQQSQSNVNEASGYIPSEKEKNDPRFKTALTVDVKPDSIKKNAKAFSWLTNRAGIPPTANTNGSY